MTKSNPIPAALTGNQLKIIALITMTIDHIGMVLFPGISLFRIIGRLAFPIYAYMIAEGCRYTRSRRRYFLSMAAVGILCQLVYFFVADSLYQCVLVTFSLSLLIIFSLDNALKQKNARSVILAAGAFLGAYFVCSVMPELLPETDFAVDYGFMGVMLPVYVYLGNDRWTRLLGAGLGMLMVSMTFGGIQWYSLAALILLALYSGERGKVKMKHLFYIYYPLHLAVIYLLGLLLNLGQTF